MKPEGYKRRRNFRKLSLSRSFVVGSLQYILVIPVHADKAVTLPRALKDPKKSFRIGKDSVSLISLPVSELRDFPV